MDTDSISETNKQRLSRRSYAMLLLLLLGVSSALLLIAVYTQQRIAANDRAWFISRLQALVPASMHDNDLFADRVAVVSPDLLGSSEPLNVYRARRNGVATAAIFTAIATDGYGGPIQLLVAIDIDGKVLGVDVVHHSETPGIGDGFEPYRSDWLMRLVGHSLKNPLPNKWTIRKDGGDFDQFTGASVTPRAILNEVRHVLEYYATHREQVFSSVTSAPNKPIDMP